MLQLQPEQWRRFPCWSVFIAFTPLCLNLQDVLLRALCCCCCSRKLTIKAVLTTALFVCLFPCSSLWKTPLSAKQTVSMGSHERPAVNLPNLSAAYRWSKFYVVKSSQHPSVMKSCVKCSVCLSSSHPGKFCFLSWKTLKTFNNSQTGNDALLYYRWIPDSEMYLYLLSFVHVGILFLIVLYIQS